MQAKWVAWCVDRLGLEPIKDSILNRRVAKSPWYFGDGASLALLFTVLVLTGMLMTLTYSPSPDHAADSVRYITEEQSLGWFVRGLHYWSAGMMVVMIYFHLCRQVTLGGYKSPREGTWIIGVLLFFAVLFMSFSGYVLRWDERAVYALRVSLNMLYQLPVIGESLVIWFQGSDQPGAVTIARFYGLHVVIMPLLIIGLISYHLYLVILWGITSKKEREQPIYSAEEQKKLYKEQAKSEKFGESFFPTTMFHSGVFAVAIFSIPFLLTLTLGPQELQTEANLTKTTIPAEEWWFWWYSALIALLPNWLAPIFFVVFPLLSFLFLLLLPWIDNGPYRGVKKRPWALGLVLTITVGILILTDLRRRSPWTGWPSNELPPVPEGLDLTPEVEEGRRLFVHFGCTSCHAVSGEGRYVGSDLARLEHRYSRNEARNYIKNPPAGVPMPSYEDILSAEELERLIDFWLVAQTFEREP